MDQYRVLVVEDDQRIGSTLERALTAAGYIVTWATTGSDALAANAAAPADLVLLDLGLPDIDGLDVCKQLHHTRPSLDIIMLTARDQELDIVVGLDAGAVDYITKPFSLAELIARLRAQLRRNTAKPTTTMTVGDLMIDTDNRTVHIGREEVTFRPKEFDLLVRLASEPNRVIRRETLMNDVWDEHWFGPTKTLDFHIAALRRHLDRPGLTVGQISTVRGVGFRYETSRHQ